MAPARTTLLTLAAILVALAGALVPASPVRAAASGAGGRVLDASAPIHRFERASRVFVAFAFRRDDHSQVLVRLVANRLALTEDHGRLLVRLRGRRVAIRSGLMPRRRWVSVGFTVSSQHGSVSLVVGKRRRSARHLRIALEHAVQVGANCRRSGGPCRFSSLPVSSARTPSARPGPPAASTPPVATDPRPFAPTSFWNAPLAAQPPLDPKSSTYVSELAAAARQNPWLNYNRYSTPVYTVPRDQPRVLVTLDTSASALQAAWQSVPIPANAQPAAGTDQHMVVWQPSTDTMWEFWLAARKADGWHARWGGVINNVSQNPGFYQNPSDWGATATSLPLLGGLMRISELRTGHIDHALAIAIPAARAEYFSSPAQRTDGYVRDANAIPEGARFRLDPNLDIPSLHLPPLTRMIAEAAQRYGIVVRDQSGCVCFYGEDPTPTGTDPYAAPNGFFGSERWVNNLLQRFPWERLQALKTDQSCCWKR